MEIPKRFDKGHHLYTDNLFKTYAAAVYLLKMLFLTETMRQNYALTSCQIKLSLQTQKYDRKLILGKINSCHVVSTEKVAEQTCYNVVNILWCFWFP